MYLLAQPAGCSTLLSGCATRGGPGHEPSLAQSPSPHRARCRGARPACMPTLTPVYILAPTAGAGPSHHPPSPGTSPLRAARHFPPRYLPATTPTPPPVPPPSNETSPALRANAVFADRPPGNCCHGGAAAAVLLVGGVGCHHPPVRRRWLRLRWRRATQPGRPPASPGRSPPPVAGWRDCTVVGWWRGASPDPGRRQPAAPPCLPPSPPLPPDLAHFHPPPPRRRTPAGGCRAADLFFFW